MIDNGAHKAKRKLLKELEILGEALEILQANGKNKAVTAYLVKRQLAVMLNLAHSEVGRAKILQTGSAAWL